MLKLKKSYSQYYLILVGIFSLLISFCSHRKNQSAIVWIYDIDSALTIAEQINKPLMIDFMADWCPPCIAMEETTFSDPVVIAKSRQFVTVRIDVDKQPEIAAQYNGNARKYGGIGIPNMLFLTADQDTLEHIVGFYKPSDLTVIMDSVLSRSNSFSNN